MPKIETARPTTAPPCGQSRPEAPVRLVRVRPCEAHIEALYGLLGARSHGISHAQMPSMDRHRRFVRRHPYRVWYLIGCGAHWIGSVYLLPCNAVGIAMREGFDDRIGEVLARVFARHRPLPAVSSVRSAVFSFNVAPTNARLIAALTALGGEVVQQTYVLPGGGAPTERGA